MSFSLNSGRSTSEAFLAKSANGAEVWTAQDGDYRSTRFESWTRAGGWKRILSEGDISSWTMVGSKDGSYVASEIYSTGDSGFSSVRSGPPGQPVLVLVDVYSGTQSPIRPIYDPTANWCQLYGVSDGGAPILSCRDESYSDQLWRMAKDGKPLSALSADALQLPTNFWDLSGADLPSLGISPVSAANEMQVYEVSVGSGVSSKVVLKAGVDIPYWGVGG